MGACILDWASDGACGNDILGSSEPTVSESNSQRIVEILLLYQGDLARYLLEIEDSPTYESFAKRCYMQAMSVNPSSVQSMCQMGTLMSTKNFRMESVCWYFRCLQKSHDPKAKLNLERILQKNEKLYRECVALNTAEGMQPSEFLEFLTKRFCSSLIYVMGRLFHKPEHESLGMSELTRCFQNILTEFSELCKFFWSSVQHYALFLNDSIIFTSVQLCILTIENLKRNNSSKLHVTIGFVLSYFAKIIHFSVLRLDFIIQSFNIFHSSVSKLGVKDSNKNDALSTGSFNHPSTIKKSAKKPRRHPRRRRARVSPDLLSEDEEDELEFCTDRTDQSVSSSNEEDVSDVSVSEPSLDGDAEENLLHEAANNETGKTDEASSNLAGAACNVSSTGVLPKEPDYNAKLLISLHDFEIAKALPSLSDIVVDISMGNSFAQSILVSPLRESYLVAVEIKSFLAPVKIFTSWLKWNSDIMDLTVGLSFNRWLISLLNRLPVDKLYSQGQYSHGLNTELLTCPTTEDYAVRNIPCFDDVFCDVNWNPPISLSTADESFVRLRTLREFGKWVASREIYGITFSVISEEFNCVTENDIWTQADINKFVKTSEKNRAPDSVETDIGKGDAHDVLNEKERQKLKLMESMGQLRLKSEVERLRKQVEQISSKNPFLIPEVFCLTNKLDIVKKLIESKQFIVIICKTVFNSLDSLKKDQPMAREAIKYLENKLSSQDSGVRAQKDQEVCPVDVSSVTFNWRRNRKLVALCDMLACANYYVQPHIKSRSAMPNVEINERYMPATLLFENQPDPSSMGSILSVLGPKSAIGWDVLDNFCQNFFSVK